MYTTQQYDTTTILFYEIAVHSFIQRITLRYNIMLIEETLALFRGGDHFTGFHYSSCSVSQ